MEPNILHKNGKTAWNGTSAFYSDGKTVCWNGESAFYLNGRPAWSNGNAYYENKDVAWNKVAAFLPDHSVTTLVEISLSDGFSIAGGPSEFRLYLNNNLLVER